MVYLIEFRFHGYAKWYAKNLIYDVARRFKVKGVTENRAVPHIFLYSDLFRPMMKEGLYQRLFPLEKDMI